MLLKIPVTINVNNLVV